MDDSEELQQALSGSHPDDGSGAWARTREYSIWAVALMTKNAGKEEGARARADCALGDLRRAWRNTFFVRHYEVREPAGDAEPLPAVAPAVVVPAGCVLIDSALGEIPPPIFGLPVRMVFPVPRKRKVGTGLGAMRVQAMCVRSRRDQGLVTRSPQNPKTPREDLWF